jgi:hypothetical protein
VVVMIKVTIVAVAVATAAEAEKDINHSFFIKLEPSHLRWFFFC